jgi:hypothetical protein
MVLTSTTTATSQGEKGFFLGWAMSGLRKLRHLQEMWFVSQLPWQQKQR